MFDLIELEKLVESGDVAKRKHPTKDLYIYSYLKTWYPEWSETLRWARGLILDSEGKLIACPFKKFFNYSEIKTEVDELIAKGVPHRIQEKLDGSLGILFYYEDEWHLSTKGSFTSEQAIKAKEILEAAYKEYVCCDKNLTYLFEIIYPENQIVISYKEEKLVLLATMDPKTMKEVPMHDGSWMDQVIHYNELKISDVIKDMSRPDYCSAEGFVVVFDDGTRVKFKYDEYVKLHKIVSDFKPKNVVELMKVGGDINELIESLPDEFRQELIDVKVNTEKLWMSTAFFILASFWLIMTEDKKTFAINNIKQFPQFKALLFELWKDYYQREIKELSIETIKKNVHLNEMIYDKILEEL